MLLVVAAWPLAFYWRAALGTGLFYFGDIARFFYPTRLLYSQALQTGRLPLWSPEMLLGFPLFAEMQTGALYPPHLVLYRLLPLDLALNYDILLHLAWLAAGAFLFARGHGASRPAAAVTALALSAGGFGAGRITHLSVLAVAAWLPWILWAYDRWRRRPRPGTWALLVVMWALQFLAGHPQFMLLNVLTFGAYAVGTAIEGLPSPRGMPGRRLARELWEQSTRTLLLPVLTAALGAGIAAVQLWPGAQLALESARAGGVTEAFFTEFSYNPLFLALWIDPFVLGNPYPRVSVEVVAYFGALPLLLAVVGAIKRRREHQTRFWVILALGAFLLALGGFNPLYRALRVLPLLNLFRVPARFLFPLSLAVAMLAASGLDSLRERLKEDASLRGAVPSAAVAALLVAMVIALTPVLGADAWVQLWRVLAIVFWVAALLVALLATRRRLNRNTFAGLAVGLTLVDLAAFGAVYAQTFNVIAPRAEIFATPRVLPALSIQEGARIRTSEWVFPWISVMRESLYPNLNAAYGVQAAHGYTPLIPRRTQAFLDALSPRMLNLLGVRYYLVPQVLPVDAATEAANLNDPFMIHPVGQTLTFPPTEATALEVESALAQSVELRDGDVVADIRVTTEEGRTLSMRLRAGFDTAEWAYERSDVRRVVKHSEPPIASTFPARSAFPVEEHLGHTFLGKLSLGALPVRVTSIAIQPRIAAGLVYVQKLTLADGASRVDVATLMGKGNHRLVYRSEDVAVFENRDGAPRVWLTHNALLVPSDDEALKRLQAPDYAGELLLADGQPTGSDAGQGLNEQALLVSYEPERVRVKVHAETSGYLVLADAWDPGWTVRVDRQPEPVHRANVVLRAVAVAAGDHTVEFLYRPFSLFAGLLVSGISLLILALAPLAVFLWRKSRASS